MTFLFKFWNFLFKFIVKNLVKATPTFKSKIYLDSDANAKLIFGT